MNSCILVFPLICIITVIQFSIQSPSDILLDVYQTNTLPFLLQSKRRSNTKTRFGIVLGIYPLVGSLVAPAVGQLITSSDKLRISLYTTGLELRRLRDEVIGPKPPTVD